MAEIMKTSHVVGTGRQAERRSPYHRVSLALVEREVLLEQRMRPYR